ncbi:hypothetical protein [Erythrobacter sp. WG]|nr:hypothetical protein [Erythrobacter sp. WG]MCX9147664.1 hypothetical protein [Erythrobacter sp. WG]
MPHDKDPAPDAAITARDLMIGSLIVAIGLAAFRIGYWGGRDIGAALFA